MPAKKAVKKKATKVDEQKEELAKLGITPELVTEALQELLEDAKEEAKIQSPQQSKAEKVDKALVSTVSEFLDNFMIIGFRLVGQPITMCHAQNCQGHEALKSLLLQFTRLVLNN